MTNVVVIGGGTGLSRLLRGFRNHVDSLTAIVTMGDDGSSSGRIRNELHLPPPGDLRNCLTALADDDDLLARLFGYRFHEGDSLAGHSLGNLLVAALCDMTGSVDSAVAQAGRLLKIPGEVLPATLDNMQLVAEMEDGETVTGESSITAYGGRIANLMTIPGTCRPLPKALEAIGNADLIALGPGSLYTSIVAVLLIDGIAEAIKKSRARKIYVCNLMGQPGETIGYSVADHVEALARYAGGQMIIDAVAVSSSRIPDAIVARYAMDGAAPVTLDRERVRAMGVEVLAGDLTMIDVDGTVKHKPDSLSQLLLESAL